MIPGFNGEFPIISSSKVASDTVVLYKGDSYRRLAPTEVCGTGAAFINRMRAHEIQVQVPELSVSRIDEGLIIGPGAVVSKKGAVLLESLINAKNTRHDSLRYFYLKDDKSCVVHSVKKISRTVKNAILLKSCWSGNYGHWLVENLARLVALDLESDFKKYSIIVSSWPKAMNKIIIDSIGLLGINQDKIIFTDNEPIHFENLVLISPVSDHPFIHHPVAVDFLSRLAWRHGLRNGAPRNKRIYFTRRRTTRRRLLNENDVCDILRGFDFEIYDPEDLSFLDQMKLCFSAKVVAGASGAALTNLVFAEKGVTTIALANARFADDFFWDLTCHKGGSYVALHGKNEGENNSQQANFFIEHPKLQEILRRYA